MIENQITVDSVFEEYQQKVQTEEEKREQARRRHEEWTRRYLNALRDVVLPKLEQLADQLESKGSPVEVTAEGPGFDSNTHLAYPAVSIKVHHPSKERVILPLTVRFSCQAGRDDSLGGIEGHAHIKKHVGGVQHEADETFTPELTAARVQAIVLHHFRDVLLQK